ncbi:hypothetical protein F4780DRAFT_796531 [Xylariomycetidae sp. FL0641]|nr:hypothetical protein F4780DRAFT_796531 [Xylariomycetidae sp. FL0641]
MSINTSPASPQRGIQEVLDNIEKHMARQGMVDPAASRSRAAPPARMPLSSHATYAPRSFQPTCTHLTMTRIYDSNFICSTCHRPGLQLREHMSQGPRSPEKRADKLSFLSELTPEQLQTYTPEQVATILKQRENLLNVAALDKSSAQQNPATYVPSTGFGAASGSGATIRPPPGFGFEYSENSKPWVPDRDTECQAKYCHRCRPSCNARSFLSLNAVAQGDIPPTAAMGFGFHRMGTRPVLNANIVKNIGLRPVPWPRAVTLPSSPSSQSSFFSLEQMDDSQVPDALRLPGLSEDASSKSSSTIDSLTISSPHPDIADDVVRTASSPPSTPVAWGGVSVRRAGITSFEHQEFVSDGRSSESLRMNERVRAHAIASMPGLAITYQGYDFARDSGTATPQSPVPDPEISTLIHASLHPLPSPSAVEEAELDEAISPMMLDELEEGRFHQQPLDVGTGVAVSEEGVGLGVPDVMTQM